MLLPWLIVNPFVTATGYLAVIYYSYIFLDTLQNPLVIDIMEALKTISCYMCIFASFGIISPCINTAFEVYAARRFSEISKPVRIVGIQTVQNSTHVITMTNSVQPLMSPNYIPCYELIADRTPTAPVNNDHEYQCTSAGNNSQFMPEDAYPDQTKDSLPLL
ncbi:uncharacterized protein LOC106472491 [Limulus polyphemus]|uniref:Uncharacterized protein LOC106472491 n=1 Tax=Limulus polyphemus TaxID=6850 RepID=A0ABM1TLM5_LIMPO|nr:uncharacterized protein LOC106472491 [Limulus polyphemus]